MYHKWTKSRFLHKSKKDVTAAEKAYRYILGRNPADLETCASFAELLIDQARLLSHSKSFYSNTSPLSWRIVIPPIQFTISLGRNPADLETCASFAELLIDQACLMNPHI